MTTTPPDAPGLPLLPVPELPVRTSGKPNEGPVTFTTGHHFTAAGGDDARELAEAATAPLSVIVQVTKRCDFGCVFCSETLMMPDPTLEDLDVIRANLAGVQRVFLSGGEPLLRRDLPEIVTMYSEFILGLPTNATRGVAMASRLAGKVAFVNIGFDGPRAAFTQVRGDYDKVVAGVRAFLDAGLPVSLSAVVLRSTLHGLPYLYQIADVFDCGKLKLILPLRKGNALGLAEREFITAEEARDAFGRLTELRAVHDWRPAARSAAIVYLPLHRTRTLTVTGQTLTFGFRAASITGEADAGALTALANLDLLQARRHAAVLTGCMLGGELADLQVAAEVTLRGLAAVQAEWSSRHTSARGKAGMFDCPADLPGHPSLDEACRHAHLARSDHQIAGLDEAAAAGLTAAMVVERALVMALICARHLGRYNWDGTLDIEEIMTASTWDCLS